MKRLLFILLAFLPILSGCGSIYSNFREVEQIKVIRTMGLDRTGALIELSLSSASDLSEGSALYFSGSGSTIPDALDAIQNRSSEEELFFSHISRILIGEEAAKRGIDSLLSYICRSPELRIDTPLFIVRDSRASELMASLSESSKGVSDVLEAAEANIKTLNNSQILSTAEVISSIESFGSALICALEFSPGAEQKESAGGEKKMTASISGYAVLNGTELCSYIDMEESAAVGLLLNRVGITQINISDRQGKPITLEINSGRSRIEPRWSDDGALKGLDVYAEVSASVLEMDKQPDMSDAELSDYLISCLEAEVSERIAAVLQKSRKLGCDFLGLAGKLELSEPQRFRAMPESFLSLLPRLELRVSVSGRLSHSTDLEGV